jgi:hypothetical protein
VSDLPEDIELPKDIEEALRELAAQSAQPVPPPIARQLAQYPWSPPAIDEQPTRVLPKPPPLPPDVLSERQPTVVAREGYDLTVALEGGIASVQEAERISRRAGELEALAQRQVRDVRAIRGHLLQLAQIAETVPRSRALVRCSLDLCAQALAAVGERGAMASNEMMAGPARAGAAAAMLAWARLEWGPEVALLRGRDLRRGGLCGRPGPHRSRPGARPRHGPGAGCRGRYDGARARVRIVVART